MFVTRRRAFDTEPNPSRLYLNFKANHQRECIVDVHEGDAIIIATHSQGSVVFAHPLDRLIRDNHILALRNLISLLGTGGRSRFPLGWIRGGKCRGFVVWLSV